MHDDNRQKNIRYVLHYVGLCVHKFQQNCDSNDMIGVISSRVFMRCIYEVHVSWCRLWDPPLHFYVQLYLQLYAGQLEQQRIVATIKLEVPSWHTLWKWYSRQ